MTLREVLEEWIDKDWMDREPVTNVIQQIKALVPKKGIRDDEPLPENYNATQRYSKEAHNNMVDGYNQAIDETLKALG